MRNTKIEERVVSLIDTLSLNKCTPDTGLLDNVLRLDIVEELSSLPLREITNAIVVLSQYLISLTFHTNKFKISKRVLSKYIDDEVNRGLKSSQIKGNKEEKRRLFIDSNPSLVEAEEELEAINAELLLLENYPEAIKEYINALKKYRESTELEMKNTYPYEVSKV